MSIQSISSMYSSVYSLDEILQDFPETATKELPDNEETYQIYKEELNFELKTNDRVWLEFQAGQCEQYGKAAKSILYRIVKSSVDNLENSISSANAITILKIMKVSLSCLDLRGVRIQGADLSSTILDRADLSGANLENVTLRNASLNGTNMPKANLKNVEFFIPDIFIHEGPVFSSIISPDNKYLISEDWWHAYFWYFSSKKCIKKVKIEESNEYADFRNIKIFTPDGLFLFTYDQNQHINIWSTENFERIQKLKISDKEVEDISFLISPDGSHLITYYYEDGKEKTYLKVWVIQKTTDNFLDISLKNQAIIPYSMSNIHFSKKLPYFYNLKSLQNNADSNSEIYLCIWDIETASEIVNIPIGKVYNPPILFRSALRVSRRASDAIDIHFSLDSWDISKNNEERLSIAIGNSIYLVDIFQKKHNWALKDAQVTKIVTELDTIYRMKILLKTHELIYICNDTVCLYSIKNNKLIGKFRLSDIALDNTSISFDEVNAYIRYLNKVYIYPLDILKSSNYISYEMDNNISSFSLNTRSIISLSNSFYMNTYDIETGQLLKAHFFQKTKLHLSNCRISAMLFSRNAQHILIETYTNLSFIRNCFLINTDNEQTCLDIPLNYSTLALSSNSEYLAIINKALEDNSHFSHTLSIYKAIPQYQCIGRFGPDSKFECHFKIALSANFRKTPKIAYDKANHEVVICNFNFKDEALELLSQKTLSTNSPDILQLMFVKNDRMLIIASRSKVIIWNTEDDIHEEYNIKASCVNISLDGSMIIYHNWNQFDQNVSNHTLCLWSITQKQPLIVQTLSLAIIKLQISTDNRYIIGTVENGGMYVWKILRNSFRLLWRTSHNLQTQGLILDDNTISKEIEEDLIVKMGAMKIADK